MAQKVSKYRKQRVFTDLSVRNLNEINTDDLSIIELKRLHKRLQDLQIDLTEGRFRNIYKRVYNSDGLLIGLLSIFSYALMLTFGAGSFYYFHIPLSFISFSIENSLPITVVCAIIVLFIYLGIRTIQEYLISKGLDKFKVIMVFVYLISFVVFPILLTILIWKNFLAVILLWFSMFLAFVFLYFIPAIKSKKQNKFVDSLLDISENTTSPGLFNYMAYAAKDFGLFPFLTFVAMLVFYFSSFVTGWFISSTRGQYFITNESPECVVLYLQSDRFICAPIDRVKKEVEPNFRVIYIQDNPDIELREENIGPLHLKPTPTPTQKPTPIPTITETPLPIPTEIPIPATPP